jgi:hypothetical protein
MNVDTENQEGMLLPDHPDRDSNLLAPDDEVDALIQDIDTDAPIVTGDDDESN